MFYSQYILNRMWLYPFDLTDLIPKYCYTSNSEHAMECSLVFISSRSDHLIMSIGFDLDLEANVSRPDGSVLFTATWIDILFFATAG